MQYPNPLPAGDPATAASIGRARYYLGEVFVVETAPAEGRPTRSRGILLLPPLGYEDTCAYRPLRVLAEALAARGFLVLRLDWPGLGDSAGDAGDPDLVPRQLEAVRAATASLRARGLLQVTGIGVRAGGLLALAAGGLDELVLWGTPASGRAFLREERAFHRMAARAYGSPPPGVPPLAQGSVEAGGFLYGPETARDLEALAPAPGDLRRVLLIPRDHAEAPAELVQALGAAQCTVSAALGLGDLLEDPYHASLSPAVRDAILGWLPDGETLRPAPHRGSPQLHREGAFQERPWVEAGGRGELSGVLCEPTGGGVEGMPWTLFFNAGGVRRSGPNRLWTAAARRLAALGRPSLRLDVRDVGDSDGPSTPHRDLEEMYSQASVEDAVLAFDRLRARGAAEIDLVGLCSGAFLAIQVSDRRPVRRALLFNCLAFLWDDDARASGMTSQIGRSLLDGRRWRRLLTGRIDARALARAIGSRSRLALGDAAARLQGRPPADQVELLLRRVAGQGTEIHLVCSQGDASIDALERHVAPPYRPRMTVLPGVDHTIRPTWAHRQVLDLIAGTAPTPSPSR